MKHYRNVNLCQKCCLDKMDIETKEQDTTKKTVELAKKLVKCNKILHDPNFYCEEEISDIAQEIAKLSQNTQFAKNLIKVLMIAKAKHWAEHIEPIGIRKVPSNCPYYAEHWMYDNNLKWYERAWLNIKTTVETWFSKIRI